MKIGRSVVVLAAFAFFLFFNVTTVKANHSWGTYHWARTNNPFILNLGDNVTQAWDPYLITSSADWNTSSVLDSNVVPGRSNPRRCQPTSGRIEVCNNKYGNNGWLGIAQIWVSGDHITQGVTKLNDTYFTKPTYNTVAWKNLVMCQEIGHTFGLDHQDEAFNNPNLDTCMDYTNSPSSNQHPNFHDYEQLESIYSHLDGFTTIQYNSVQNKPFGLSVSTSMFESNFENREDWGKQLKNNGKVATFVRDLGKGNKLFTFTIWASEENNH